MILETGFTNLQFVGLASLAHEAGDYHFEKMVTSIQTDEARHAQIGPPVLALVMKHDPDYAQYLVDKWFWRNWHMFSILTGVSMDYLTGADQRSASFKEFMEEWIVDQFFRPLDEFGLKKPWYWNIFLDELEIYHQYDLCQRLHLPLHALVRFCDAQPQRSEVAASKISQVLERYGQRVGMHRRATESRGPGSGQGEPGAWNCPAGLLRSLPVAAERRNATQQYGQRAGARRRGLHFCSQPCRWNFLREPQRYANHKGLVKRVLSGEAPADFTALLTTYFSLTPDMWGKDVYAGDYDWL